MSIFDTVKTLLCTDAAARADVYARQRSWPADIAAADVRTLEEGGAWYAWIARETFGATLSVSGAPSEAHALCSLVDVLGGACDREGARRVPTFAERLDNATDAIAVYRAQERALVAHVLERTTALDDVAEPVLPALTDLAAAERGACGECGEPIPSGAAHVDCDAPEQGTTGAAEGYAPMA